MNIDDMLGIDLNDPEERHISYLLDEEEILIAALVRMRKKAELSQEDVARRMGIDHSGVSKIESGSRDLRQSTLRRYMLAVGAVARQVVTSVDEYERRSRTSRYSVSNDVRSRGSLSIVHSSKDGKARHYSGSRIEEMKQGA